MNSLVWQRLKLSASQSKKLRVALAIEVQRKRSKIACRGTQAARYSIQKIIGSAKLDIENDFNQCAIEAAAAAVSAGLIA